jgi:hypothetical protein
MERSYESARTTEWPARDADTVAAAFARDPQDALVVAEVLDIAQEGHVDAMAVVGQQRDERCGTWTVGFQQPTPSLISRTWTISRPPEMQRRSTRTP